MRFAMTGATGFIGSALARELVESGHEVTAVVRDPAAARDLAGRGVRLERGDVGDVGSLARAFAGADGVFHVAGWYKVGSRHPQEGWQVNVEGTRNALAAALRAEVPRVVYTSTCAINSDTRGRTVDETYRFTGTHLTVYDETKARAHDVAERFASDPGSPDVVIVMPGGVYGPGDTSQIGRLMRQVVQRRVVVASSRLRMVYAHVADVAHGHVLAMDRGARAQSYMLAGERSDLLSILTEIADLTGGRRPIDMPGPLFGVAQAVTSVVGRIVPLPEEFSAEALRDARASYLATSAKARRELGWTFRPLHQGLRETAEAEGWIS